MTQYEAVKALYQRWMSAWPAASTNVPFVFDNDVIAETATYARVKVEDLASDQHTLGPVGSRKWLRTGLVRVVVKSPANVGRKAADNLAAAVRSTLEGVRLAASGTEEGVFTFAATSEELSPDAQYWVLSMTVPFQYYEVR